MTHKVEELELENNGGTKIATPLWTFIIIIVTIATISVGSYAWIVNRFVEKCEYRADMEQLKSMVQDIKVNMTNVLVTLKMHKVDIEHL